MKHSLLLSLCLVLGVRTHGFAENKKILPSGYHRIRPSAVQEQRPKLNYTHNQEHDITTVGTPIVQFNYDVSTAPRRMPFYKAVYCHFSYLHRGKTYPRVMPNGKVHNRPDEVEFHITRVAEGAAGITNGTLRFDDSTLAITGDGKHHVTVKLSVDTFLQISRGKKLLLQLDPDPRSFCVQGQYMEGVRDLAETIPARNVERDLCRFVRPYPGFNLYPLTNAPRQTHIVNVYWTTMDGVETEVVIKAKGNRPSSFSSASPVFAEGRIFSGISPACDYHLYLTAKHPWMSESQGTLTFGVYGWTAEDFRSPPDVTVLYFKDGKLIGENTIEASAFSRQAN